MSLIVDFIAQTDAATPTPNELFALYHRLLFKEPAVPSTLTVYYEMGTEIAKYTAEKRDYPAGVNGRCSLIILTSERKTLSNILVVSGDCGSSGDNGTIYKNGNTVGGAIAGAGKAGNAVFMRDGETLYNGHIITHGEFAVLTRGEPVQTLDELKPLGDEVPDSLVFMWLDRAVTAAGMLPKPDHQLYIPLYFLSGGVWRTVDLSASRVDLYFDRGIVRRDENGHRSIRYDGEVNMKAVQYIQRRLSGDYACPPTLPVMDAYGMNQFLRLIQFLGIKFHPGIEQPLTPARAAEIRAAFDTD
jgi:hypothetical protein